MPPDVADLAPSDPVLTAYDQEHAVTYMRLLDADAEGADWHEVARIVLHIDPERELDRARQAFASHLARARWWQGMDTGTCFDTVGRAESRKKAYELKFAEPRLYADPNAAARKLVEIASTIESVRPHLR